MLGFHHFSKCIMQPTEGVQWCVFLLHMMPLMIGSGAAGMMEMLPSLKTRSNLILTLTALQMVKTLALHWWSKTFLTSMFTPCANFLFHITCITLAFFHPGLTTLNTINRYNCKLLLAVIDENHRGTYDFIYLPIDFKVSHSFSPKYNVWTCIKILGADSCSVCLPQNKCNVGYAFINMTDPQHIIPFYKVTQE